MKKINKYLFLSLFAATMLFSTPANSQGFSVNLGAAYGFEIESIGAQVGGSYILNENIRFGVDFTYYLPKDMGGIDYSKNSLFAKSSSSSKYNYGELNAHFQYILMMSQFVGLYGVAALGIHCLRLSSTYMGETYSSSESDFGFGFGGGVEYNMGSAAIFAELMYFPEAFKQIKATGGFRYKFGQ